VSVDIGVAGRSPAACGTPFRADRPRRTGDRGQRGSAITTKNI